MLKKKKIILSIVVLVIIFGAALFYVLTILSSNSEFKPSKDLELFTSIVEKAGGYKICSNESGSGSGDGSSGLPEVLAVYKTFKTPNDISNFLKVSLRNKYSFSATDQDSIYGETKAVYNLADNNNANKTVVRLYSDSPFTFSCTSYPVARESEASAVQKGIKLGQNESIVLVDIQHPN